MITLLTGPNTYTIQETIRTRMKTFSGTAETFDALELEPRHLPDIFTGATLFSPSRLIIIKSAAANKTLWAELDQWIEKVPEETDIILVESTPDKRTRTFKQLQKHGTVRDHQLLGEGELTKWLQTQARSLGVDFDNDIARYFLSYVGHDQWRLGSELSKLMLAEKPLRRELIQDIAEPYPEASAFELLDAAFRGDAEQSERLLELMRGREDPYQFFGLLSSQALALLAISLAGGRRPADIASDMGLHPFVVSKLVPIASKLGHRKIAELVEQLAHCDIRIKTSGVDPWHQVRLTLLNLS